MNTQPGPKKRSFMLSSLPFFMLAHAAHHLLTALPLPLLPYVQQEFHLNYMKTATVTSAFSLSAAAAQLPSGWLADRIGPTIMITTGILGVAIGGALVGVSHTYIMLILCLIFMGLMSGGYHPAATPLISTSVPANQRGRALGLHLIGGNSSFFLAPIVAGGIAGIWGWRGPYLVLAIPASVLGIFFYIYLTRRGGKTHVDELKRRQAEEALPQPGYKRRLIAFLAMMIISGGAAASVNSFLTVYMVNELGASNELAAMLLSVVYSSGLWAGPVGGYVSDRIGGIKIIIVTGFLTGLLIYALKSVTLGFGLYAVLWLRGLNQAIRGPVTEVFIMNQTPAQHRSKIFGVYYSTMQYTGAIFAPIMGVLIDKYGFDLIWTYAAAAVGVAALITTLFIWDAKC